MKKIANVIFKIHIKLFKYPCVSHVRLALNKHHSYTFQWDMGMLYVCVQDVHTVAEWFDVDKVQVKKYLCNLVEGVECE